MGKKKTQRQQDFQKVKLKVGRKVLKSQNETKITVKAKQIVIKDQLKSKAHLQEVMTRKRLTIPELLVHLAHHNPTMRYEGIAGLSELLSRESNSVLASVSAILERLSPIFVDKDGNVRRGCRNLLKKLFPVVPVDRMEPFFGLPMAHLYCAMTHIDEDIRKDSLEVVDVCLRFYPSLVVRDAKAFLDHFLLQISSKKGVGADAKASLLVSPTNKISTIRWRTEVFSRLGKVFEALKENGERRGGRKRESGAQTARHCVNDLSTDIIAEMPFSSFKLGDCLQSRQRSTTTSSSSSSSIDCATLNEFGETIIPLLIDSWIEASPTDFNLHRGQKNVSNEVFELFATIVSLLKLLLDISAQVHVETESSLRASFTKRFLPELAKRFVPFFPIHSSQNRKSSSSSSSSLVTATPMFVNLVICDILTFDNLVLLKDHPPAWVQTVFDHLSGFFSSSNLTRAGDSELTLAFDVIRRCLKSPVFVAKSLTKIFAQVTSSSSSSSSIFFQLSPEPQIMFLDFFLEFLREFSSLLSREDGFLSDLAIRSWLENLPAYLKSLVKKPSAPNSSTVSPKSPFSILASRIIGLFTSASLMNLGSFFPLRLFFAHALTREVFPKLDEDLQRSLLILAGRVDLGDELLLSHFAEFLSADYHRKHDVLMEMIIFNAASESEKTEDDDYRRRVLVLLAAVMTKKTYSDIDRMVEKRLGSYFVSGAGFDDGAPLELREFVRQTACFLDVESSFRVDHLEALLPSEIRC